MNLVHHGGKCCGVKHIYEMGGHPDWAVNSASPGNPANFVKDRLGSHVTSSEHLTTFTAPYEPASKRLDRILRYLRNYRPSGLVEITLARSQIDNWSPALVERGFREVSRFVNSNSGNEVAIFHLAYGRGSPKPSPKQVKREAAFDKDGNDIVDKKEEVR